MQIFKSESKNSILLAASLVAIAATSSIVHAENWPSKVVNIVVPTTTGSAPDTYARALADQLTKLTGGTFIVENVAAASGNVAAEGILRKAADGHTLLIGTQALMTINQSTFSQLRWQAKDFRGVARGVEAPLVLVAHPSIGVKNFAELQSWAQKEGKTAAYASFSAGTPSHFLGYQLNEKLKSEMVHVPYRGSAPQITDLLGGQVKIGFTQLATVLPHVNSGKLVGIAQSGLKRAKALPNVPTLAELGHSEMTSSVWFGVIARSDTPSALFTQLLTSVNKAHAEPAFRTRLEAQGFEMADPETSDEFNKAISEESIRWTKVVKATGFKAIE